MGRVRTPTYLQDGAQANPTTRSELRSQVTVKASKASATAAVRFETPSFR